MTKRERLQRYKTEWQFRKRSEGRTLNVKISKAYRQLVKRILNLKEQP